MPDHSLVCFCLLFAGVFLYAVMRFTESISSLEETRTRSQASSVIPWCPVTAVSGIRACGCRYPILHLCHSKPADQQSNFTQARSEGGTADAGMGGDLCLDKDKKLFEVAKGVVDGGGSTEMGLAN